MRHFAACLAALLLTAALLTSCAPKAAPPGGSESAPPPPAAAPQSRVRIEPSGKSAVGEIAVEHGATAQDLGLAFYPGATVNKSGQVQGPKGAVGGAELQTTQPYAGVVKFYRQKYAAQKPAIQTLEEPAGPITMLNWQDLQGNYTVVIKRDEAGKRTVITLARTSN